MEKNIIVTQKADGTVDSIYWYEDDVYVEMSRTETSRIVIYCNPVTLDLGVLQELKEKYFN